MEKLFKGLTLIGIILTLAEFISRLMNKSICSTQGCKIVAESVRFSDAIIVFIGLLTFSLIFLLSFCKDELCQNSIDALLITSLSAEGVFVGYQLFKVKTICLFCITVFSIFVILSFVRSFKRPFVLTGFVSFFAVLLLNYMLKPVKAQMPVISSNYTILYKEGCPHCEKVMEEARKQNIKFKAIEVKNFLPLTKTLNIKNVPILIVKKPDERIIIVGDKNIENFLFKENKPNSEGNLNSEGFCPIDAGNCTE